MEVFKRIPLNVKGKDYEIRVLYDNTVINVVAFLNNHPANGYRHQIRLPKKCNALGVLEQNIAEGLIEITKRNIIEKRWEKTSKIIEQNILHP